MKKLLGRLLLVVFILNAFFIPFSTDEAKAAQEAITVRIGVYPQGGFLEFDDQGNPTGYFVEYMAHIANAAGINVEYINTYSYASTVTKLRSMQIDLMAPARITEEKKGYYSFSEENIGTDYGAVVTTLDRDDLYYEDYEFWGDLRIGGVVGDQSTQAFLDKMESLGIPINLIEFGSQETVLDALDVDAIDVGIVDLMYVQDDAYKVLGRFHPFTIHFATWKGNEEVMERIDAGIRSVKNNFIGLESQLLEEYMPMFGRQYFTREEIEYATSLPSLKVGYIEERKPLSFTNSKGELDGISRAIFDKIAESAGLQFEYVALPSKDVTLAYLRENGFDLVTGVEENRSNLSSKYISVTNPYLEGERILVGRTTDFDLEKSYKAAVSTGSQTLAKEILQEFDNFEIENYDSVEQCFEALYNHEVDWVVQNQYVLDYIMAKPRYSDFYVVSLAGMDDNLCFSTVVKDGRDSKENDLLCSILNKAISRVKERDLAGTIIVEQAKYNYEYTLWDYLYKYWSIIIFGGAFVIMFLCGSSYYRNIQKRHKEEVEREENERKLEQKRYQLILEESEEMIFEIRLSAKPTEVSERIRMKFGWKQKQWPRIDELSQLFYNDQFALADYVYHEDVDTFRIGMKLLTETRKKQEATVRFLCADNSPIWCRVSASPVEDSAGKLVSIVGRIVDVHEETIRKLELEKAAYMDIPTGLPNKGRCDEVFDVPGIAPEGTAVLMFDLNNLKITNDTLGHKMGDELIREFAYALRKVIREETPNGKIGNVDNFLGRFGGDEFVAVIPSSDEISIKIVLHEIQDEISRINNRHRTSSVVEEHYQISYSVGCALVDEKKTPDETYLVEGEYTLQELLRIADARMYEYKRRYKENYAKLVKFKGNGKIMIVDDSQSMREFLSEIFENEGYDVFEAVNGEDLFEKINFVEPDIVIMDLIMPVLDGMTATLMLRAKYPNIKIVVCTVCDDKDSQAESFANGADDFISKPFNVERIVETVEKLLMTK